MITSLYPPVLVHGNTRLSESAQSHAGMHHWTAISNANRANDNQQLWLTHVFHEFEPCFVKKKEKKKKRRKGTTLGKDVTFQGAGVTIAYPDKASVRANLSALQSHAGEWDQTCDKWHELRK